MLLPIDAFLPEILRSLESVPRLVLVAEPGAGKTTRLPPALLGASFAKHGQVLVLEPRRIAARLSARRVAEELGERVGQRIGYVVRFEREISDKTRVVFLTEALLTRRLLEEPALKGVNTVVLDEFHERSLHTDLGLALLTRLTQTVRPDLRLVVMSATLDAEKVASFLDAPIVRVPGRAYPVNVEYLERPDERHLDEQVASAVRKLAVRGLEGDVLVFLPGAAEIRRAQTACANVAATFDLELAMLHGDLDKAEQDRAISQGKRHKIILSTNIAETSLTLEGVVAVIDSGLVRSAGHSPWSGLPTLSTQKTSQASATQRAGRAGRVREGLCLRLYTKPDHDARPRFDVPEIAKSDLCETELLLRALLAGEAETLRWLEPPPEAAKQAADTLLKRLGAISELGAVTALGRMLLAMPVHPRVGRLAVAAAERGYHEEGATMAALLGERDLRSAGRSSFGERGKVHDDVGASDLMSRFDAFDALAGDVSAASARRHGLDFNQVRAVSRTRDQLLQAIRRTERKIFDQDFDTAMRVATLLAFPDRVGRRRAKNSRDIVLSAGGSAQLAEASVVKEEALLVAVEADDRGRSGATIRTASGVEPEWLLEYFSDHIREVREVRFDGPTQRVHVLQRISYDGLVLDESRAGAARGEQVSDDVSACLAEAALRAGANAPWDVDTVEAWRRRCLFCAPFDPQVLPLDETHFLQAVRAHSAGKQSFEELRAEPLEHSLPGLLGSDVQARVERLAPRKLKLPSGRELTIHYELDRPPWVESRLQDFFGMTDGPKLANGKVPLVIHLLAPNQRPVQVTTDLSGFWDRHYDGVRRELIRRYPRHSWPDDPRTAAPPSPTSPRPRRK